MLILQINRCIKASEIFFYFALPAQYYSINWIEIKKKLVCSSHRMMNLFLFLLPYY